MAVDVQKRNRRQNAWQKENKDRINFTMPRGYKAAISKAAEKEKIKSSEFIRRAIDRQLADYGVEIPLQSQEEMVD